MKRFLVFFFGCVFLSTSHAFEKFVIRDIRLEGLQRIEIGTVFNYLPVKVGDTFNEQLSSRAIRALYKTGFFKDVELAREDDVLVVYVTERPAIADVTFSGNSEIPDEQLKDALSQIGLAQGRILDRSLLDKVEQELERQYFSLGKYAVKIQTKLTDLERNRVDVKIEIAEGETAKIQEVRIVGNAAFDDKKLLGRLDLASVSFFSGKSSYSKQILAGDLEKLKSYYLDRGYINFTIDSTQVSLTPDKQDVYITINLTEGEQYTVSEMKLAGDLVVGEDEITKLLVINKGEVFSRSKAAQSTQAVSDRLAESGYAFANVNLIPEIDKDSRTVALTLFVDPGKRVYVRRVNISGNNKTRDEVIRRELRQLESSWLSTKQVSDSRTRLNRLGYFEEVSVETPSVPGTSDQVDVNYAITERSTGSLSAGLGFSDTQGLLVNASIVQANFAGTGKRVALEINVSEVTKLFSFSYRNPYFTDSGISAGFRVFAREVDAAAANVTNYTTDSYGASVDWGMPLSELQRITYGFEYKNLELILGDNVATQIQDFVDVYGNEYDIFTLSTNWRRDSRNRAIFPDSGSVTRGGVDLTVPGGDLQYYKLNFEHRQYIPVFRNIPFMYRVDLSTGDGYGDTAVLPPFENFFAGGSRSVRGYEALTLGGPNTRDSQDNPIGGTSKIVANLELLFPNPFAENSDSVRFGLFVDGGWVYAEQDPIDLGELRYAAGIGATWMAPIGAMRFSLAAPLNDKEGDKTQAFQFTLGTPF
jgi:outer membrane protein insertion porin family